ncbi:hypothetical protein NMG60_11034819 [Bertholletia excelsa]
MAAKGIQMGLVLVLVAVLCHEAMAQSSCISVLMGMTPCLNFVSGNSSTPSSSCCSQLSNVVQSQPRCLCYLLNGTAASYGYNINQTLALSLPGACNVKTPPVSQCNSASGPSAPAPTSETTPGSSPADSTPSDSSDKTPSTPSASNTPLPGAGSKASPSTKTASSAGNTIGSSLILTVLLLFITSYASTTTRF